MHCCYSLSHSTYGQQQLANVASRDLCSFSSRLSIVAAEVDQTTEVDDCSRRDDDGSRTEISLHLYDLSSSPLKPRVSINLVTHNRSISQSQIIPSLSLYWHCIGAERWETCECTCTCVRTRVPEQDSQNSQIRRESVRVCLVTTSIVAQSPSG